MQMEYCRVIFKSSWWVTVVLHVPSMDLYTQQKYKYSMEKYNMVCMFNQRPESHSILVYFPPQ